MTRGNIQETRSPSCERLQRIVDIKDGFVETKTPRETDLVGRGCRRVRVRVNEDLRDGPPIRMSSVGQWLSPYRL